MCVESHIYMKGKRAVAPDMEPIGIVISRGAQPEHPPMVFAYVWGPAPEPNDEPESKVAAGEDDTTVGRQPPTYDPEVPLPSYDLEEIGPEDVARRSYSEPSIRAAIAAQRSAVHDIDDPFAEGALPSFPLDGGPESAVAFELKPERDGTVRLPVDTIAEENPAPKAGTMRE